MTFQNKEPRSAEFTSSEFKNAVKLSDLKQKMSAPPSYHSAMTAEAEKQGHHNTALQAQQPAKSNPKRKYPEAKPNYPSTAEEGLLEHILARRLESNKNLREYEGDIVVDWCVTITKTLTVIFLIFMIVYTGYKWWSLGPHYAKNYRDSDLGVHQPVT